jgi:hypothetical protein
MRRLVVPTLVALVVVTGVAVAGTNLKLSHRARVDVDGDGRADLVTLRSTGGASGRLEVDLASGRRLVTRTPSDAAFLPALVSAGAVAGRPGAVLFVDVLHITTEEEIRIYSDWHGQLRAATTLPAYGEDSGIRFGITCSSAGSSHFVTNHKFLLDLSAHPRHWTRQDTGYVWAGPALRLASRGAKERISGGPPAGLVGVHCGRLPTP